MRLALLLAASAAAIYAHRLDEYLQDAVFSLDNGHIGVQLRLTPGVAVLPAVLAAIDENRDGVISEPESRAYAVRVVGDLRLSVDGSPRELRLTSVRFPPMAQIQQGLGVIELDLDTPILPQGSHRIAFENRHQRAISVYLANSRKPTDPATTIDRQDRNYEQSEYTVQFSHHSFAEASNWLVVAILGGLLFARFLGVGANGV